MYIINCMRILIIYSIAYHTGIFSQLLIFVVKLHVVKVSYIVFPFDEIYFASQCLMLTNVYSNTSILLCVTCLYFMYSNCYWCPLKGVMFFCKLS